MSPTEKIPLGAEAVDALLGGGIECDCITELYGEGGSGKTNICLQLSRNVVQSGKKVVYIDTEGISLERYKQICGKHFEEALKRTLFFKPYNIEEQDKNIADAVKLVVAKKDEIGLLVLDSATLHYRAELGMENDVDERGLLNRQLMRLAMLARKVECPVLITTQVYTDSEKNALMPIGGYILGTYARTILFLKKKGIGRRAAVIIKHRSIPEGAEAEFEIFAGGVR